MKTFKQFLLVVLLIAVNVAFGQGVPTTMNYHGKLENSDGTPLNGSYSIRFAIYVEPASGAVFWTETHAAVSVTEGIFDVLLGSVTPFTNDLFTHPTLYLGIKVNDDGEMTPRSLISSVPFAIKAGDAASGGEWTISGENIYRATGNVGIGKSDPTSKLDVGGTIRATSNDFFTAAVIGEGNIIGVYGQSPGAGVYGRGGLYGVWGVADLTKSADALAGYFDGKVGIGTLNPSTQLEVNGTIKATNSEFFASAINASGNAFGVYSEAPGAGLYGKGGLYGVWGVADVSKSANAAAGFFDGKVGVGIIPQTQLDVAGGQISVRGKGAPISGKTLELAYNQTSNQGEVFPYDRSDNVYLPLRIDASLVKINASAESGNVSIGTSNNEGRLHIYNGAFNGPELYLEGGSGTEGDIAWKSSEALQIGLWDSDADTYSNVLTLENTHSLKLYNSDGDVRAALLSTENDTDGAQFTLYDSEGNASIILDAQNGGEVGSKSRIFTESLQITGGSDLAEPFEITGEEAVAGMLLTIDPENPGKLKVAAKAYDKCVAGIISGAGGINTGMIMGQKGTVADGKFPVALSGRVYCFTTDTNGQINPGDMLTTSPVKGYAMKVTDFSLAQGAIIGKAMTSPDKETGLVLVLVTLQ
jgi:hypothetical protein